MDTFYAILAQGGENPLQALFFIMSRGGFIVFFPLFIWMAWSGWKNWLQNKYISKKQYVLLAIDVPKLTEQSMKAVEQIMTALHGVHFGPNRKEKYWIGVVQDKFSLEIVSIDGYIQYFAYCDTYNMELVKGAIYAQYPDAEIVEVEDYVRNVPQQYPDENYDMFGTELVLAKPDVYPIKTYEFFEHSLSGLFADPLASLLELLSRLRPGEHVWIQIILTPEGREWREKGIKEVNKLIEKPNPQSGGGVLDFVGNAPLKALEFTHDVVFTGLATSESQSSSSSQRVEPPSQGNFMNMTSGEKVVVEEIQKKIARLTFKTKIRCLYIAPKDIMNSYRVIGSVFGAIKQFNTLDLNAITSGGKTATSAPTYLFMNRRRTRRKNKIIMAYRNRSNWAGEGPSVFSTTELATIFHFPSETVRAPLVSKTEAKKAEPPARLPMAESPFAPLRKGHQRILTTQQLPFSEPPSSAEESPAVFSAPSPAYTTPPPPVPPAASSVPPQPMYAPPQPPASTPPLPPSASAYSLHSMPGLPPGVHPVQHPSASSQPPAVATNSGTDSPTHKGSPPRNLPIG